MELVKNKAEIKAEPETDGEKPNIDTSFESCHEFLCEVSSNLTFFSFIFLIKMSLTTSPINFQCHIFFLQLIESSNQKCRGPYMARLELYRVMVNNEFDAKQLLGEFIEMLIDYFRVFGEKPCCAKDIVLFLDELKEEQRPELASKLIQLCNISATTLPQTV